MRKLIFILILITFISTSVSAEESLILKLKVEGAIDPIVADYIARGIAEAEKNNATALIIQLDTPGGLDLAMRKIIKDIQSSPVPVVTYVYPKGARAASAGSFILIASHIAAMAPGTNVGAAHPVSIEGRDVSEKIVNDAKAYIKSIAKLRGRNVTLAESFVVNSTSITAEEALEYNIIDIVAEDYPSLLAQLNGKRVENKTLKTKNAKIKEIPMNFREEILHIISNPNIAYILFMAGIYGIIFELANPGAILPGVVGGICI
ncbi:MAG: nodulation protein NfeD, partial [Candidatus Hydrothermarchaeota archaeon]